MISRIEKLEFTERYTGLMPDGEIARELNTDVSELREIRAEFSQKCWTCKNACNGNKCAWVKTHIYPAYVEIAGDGRIVRCEKYEFDFR